MMIIKAKWSSMTHLTVTLRFIILCLDMLLKVSIKSNHKYLPGGAAVKNLPANARDIGSIPGPGRCHMPQRN